MALQILSYIAFVIALLAIIVRVIKYASAPLSMRWELYPVPHERGRSEYGGSYLEELNWWTKPKETDNLNELKEMLSEILLLKGVFHHNKKVWTWSFPFHLGMYFSIGWLVMLLVGAVLAAFDMNISAGGGTIGQIIHYLTIPFGYAGLGLSAIGAFGLFIWRMSDSEQRAFNTFADYFNLVLVFGVTGLALVSHLVGDPSFVTVRAYMASLVTFSTPPAVSTLMMIEIALVSLVIMYIPLTRMSHFVAKYFLYHAVRWNDEANERGSKIEKRIVELLQQKVGWSAAHIKTGETWAAVVTEETKNE